MEAVDMMLEAEVMILVEVAMEVDTVVDTAEV